MSGNNNSQVEASQNELCPLTDEQLSSIKASFSVAGEIRAVLGAPGYAISDDGRVFSTRPCPRLKNGPRELRRTKTGAGYLMVRLQINKKQTADGVHRLMAKTFLPLPLPGQNMVRHLDGNPANNDLANLAWGTQFDNMADAIRHGRTLKGLKNPSAKLNEKRARLARELAEEGIGHSLIAYLFGVSAGTISRVCSGNQWGHVQ